MPYHAPVADELGTLYRLAREQVESLVRSLSPQQLEAAVPACPGWTVHGVVSHLAGVATDAINGRLSGVPGPDQTAAQVAERSTTPTAVVLREWERTGSQMEALLAKTGSGSAPVIDVAVHEQDIRGALGLPGNRQGPVIDLALHRAADLLESRIESAGLPDLKVQAETESEPTLGRENASVTLRASRFELFRSIYGRRSRTQLERRLVGTDDPGAYIDLLCILGPAERDLIE